MILEMSKPAWTHFHSRFVEWQNGLIVACWGLYLLLHPGMFESNGMISLWAGLKAVAPQNTWGIAAFLVGSARLMALYVNGRHRRTPAVRLIASFMSSFIITQIFLGLYNSGVPGTGLVVYPILVLADIYSAFRASADMTYVANKDAPLDHVLESQRDVSYSQRT
jgi:hypothetical protein